MDWDFPDPICQILVARGNTYTAEARQALIDAWNSIGYPCPEYLQVKIKASLL